MVMASDQLSALCGRVRCFLEERICPAETALDRGGPQAARVLRQLQQEARERGLWALPHPVELGGAGLALIEYVAIGEIEGRSAHGPTVLGSHTLLDALMLHRHAQPALRARLLGPLVGGDALPSFGMTGPGVPGSDPSQLRTRAVLDGGSWVVSGRKWFTSGARQATFTTVMCRTEEQVPDRVAFSMIVVPTDTPGYEIVRETPVLGLHGGHCEVNYRQVRVPGDHLLGSRGAGFAIAQERLGIGRTLRCMRWLGQAQRAFELMCTRLNQRSAFGERLADKQLLQQHVFDSYTEIQAARLLTLQASSRLDRGGDARVEIGACKVVAARMLQNVTDRAIQVFGAEGLTDDTPLSALFRAARATRIYDGPDEVHISTVARRILAEHQAGRPLDFGA
jgi:acyl-CoA dehydrogenase